MRFYALRPFNSSYVTVFSWLHGGEQVANGKLPEAVFTQSEFLNYVAPQGSTRFNYASVYYNQTQDVHPPLFYFLLHRCAHYFRAALQNGRVWG